MWLKIKQEGQTAGVGPCFHLPGQPILEFRFFEPQPFQPEYVLLPSNVNQDSTQRKETTRWNFFCSRKKPHELFPRRTRSASSWRPPSKGRRSGRRRGPAFARARDLFFVCLFFLKKKTDGGCPTYCKYLFCSPLFFRR